MTTQTRHTYHGELKRAIETTGIIDGNVLAGCLAEWETSRKVHSQFVEALKECITHDGAVAWRNAEFAGRRLEAISNIARAALALAEKGGK